MGFSFRHTRRGGLISIFSNLDQLSRCHIHDLSLFVHLGCSLQERSVLQEVRVFIDVVFTAPPLGEKTDCLDDTICYDEMCHLLRDYVKDRQFQLVEKMARECLSILNKKYPFAFIRLTCHKQAPVEGLRGGVRYSCGVSV